MKYRNADHRRSRRVKRLPRRRRSRAFSIQKAIAAKNGTALSWPEGDRGFPSALRTVGHGLGTLMAGSRSSLPLAFTRLATLGFVLKVLIVEKVLLSSGKNEIRPTVGAFQRSVLKLHRLPLLPAIRAPRPCPESVEYCVYSTSRRLFFRLRLRASACLTRFFSPGFK